MQKVYLSPLAHGEIRRAGIFLAMDNQTLSLINNDQVTGLIDFKRHLLHKRRRGLNKRFGRRRRKRWKHPENKRRRDLLRLFTQ